VIFGPTFLIYYPMRVKSGVRSDYFLKMFDVILLRLFYDGFDCLSLVASAGMAVLTVIWK
jgi:hypothetical protein